MVSATADALAAAAFGLSRGCAPPFPPPFPPLPPFPPDVEEETLPGVVECVR